MLPLLIECLLSLSQFATKTSTFSPSAGVPMPSPTSSTMSKAPQPSPGMNMSVNTPAPASGNHWQQAVPLLTSLCYRKLSSLVAGMTPQDQTAPSPASFVPSASSMTDEDQQYMDKLNEMSVYIEPLRKMISNLTKENKSSAEFNKLSYLYSVVMPGSK